MKSVGVRFVVVAVASAGLLAGCGGDGGSENRTARDTAEAYVQARNQGDAGRVCELYSEGLRTKLGASNCAAFVKEQTAGVATSFTLMGVKENGDRATATLRATAAEVGGGGQLRITLQRQDGEWKITGLGARGPE